MTPCMNPESWKLNHYQELKIKNSSPRLSIFPVRDDYRMNDPARKAVLSAPTEGRRTREEQ